MTYAPAAVPGAGSVHGKVTDTFALHPAHELHTDGRGYHISVETDPVPSFGFGAEYDRARMPLQTSKVNVRVTSQRDLYNGPAYDGQLSVLATLKSLNLAWFVVISEWPPGMPTWA